jgi:hypothetical protein
MGLREALLLVLLVVVAQAAVCALENCDECDWSTSVIPDGETEYANPTDCLTCHGWYESSWDTYQCVLSARLIILCVVVGLLLIAVVICSIFKIQDYRAKYTERPTNIESLESNVPEASEEELKRLTWQHSSVRINDISRCNICEANGGSVRLACGHVFHGDCICWELRKRSSCPVCSSTDTRECTVHCIKCLSSFIKCPPELYVDIKKRKSRVCDECSRKE